MKYKLNDYDLVLQNLIDELKKENIYFSKSSSDGRLNSIINEIEIVEVLLKIYKRIPIFNKWNLSLSAHPTPRYWYDILISDPEKEFYCPINIKITNLNKASADNISSKEGLYFSLTGEIKEKCPNSWSEYLELLSKNIKEHERDYYFLVFDKIDNKKIIFNSMRRIKSLTPNGNNLPFQCKWFDNTIPYNRNFEEAQNFLIENLYISINKRAKILEDFNNAFKEYIAKIQK
ncbi:hypothetical protein V2E24_00045 [Mycoplasmopsis ciconiae]|uniref:Restriction endonuclease n=1 Tax=Mycoplasmopsis ciconiae TaxID=561067 RepID=A0ABU7MKB1_9BACT|nr:hypothetical protein [Mycoplasmopsis ciconiae]